jgi:hypothetical protein
MSLIFFGKRNES